MVQQPVVPATDSALDAADAASPVEAVEAVTRELGLTLGATKVSFLIADLSGRALVRLAHLQLSSTDATATSALPGANERRALEESATVLPFDGGPAEQAIRTQQVQVLDPQPMGAASNGGGQWLVLAPVTERGEAIGVLELTLPGRAGCRGRRADRPAGARAGVRGDRQPASHRPLRVGAAHPPLEPVSGDPAPAAARPPDLRGGVLHPRRAGWSRRPTSPATPSTSAWTATCCTCP